VTQTKALRLVYLCDSKIETKKSSERNSITVD